VIADEPFRLKRLPRALWDMPLKMAERLPDGLYQDFVIFWTRMKRAIRKSP
jgi:hypothetical protein